MKILIASILPAKDPQSWSGTCSSICSQLATHHSVQVCYSITAHKLQKILAYSSKLFYKITGKRLNVYFNAWVAFLYSKALQDHIAEYTPDLIVCLGSGTELAYLKPTQTTILIADACFGLLKDAYPLYTNLTNKGIKSAYALEKKSFSNFDLLCFSSSWAEQTATEDYPFVHTALVSFGSNLNYEDFTPTKLRNTQKTKLLCIGVDYVRKGIDLAEELAQNTHSELTVVGIDLKLDKRKKTERDRLVQEYKNAHFFVLFPTTDCTPIVINEANSFGLPVLAYPVGGISDMIRDGVNGHKVQNLAEAEKWIKYYTKNQAEYAELRKTAYKHYKTDLSWAIFEQKLMKHIEKIAQK